ncbi:hypothetical protein [Roseisolibacter sp. H3M3-2]|uniref:hypothetical protein n=1 Tax=Roseisolibacter sp. H3M3-2 TaxID=3031323 RepID=UPI0023DC3C11|nr:hypothetical protein [Roseisolibacter sp. H3M3-2]MDF1504980.1 hypothetical protein [Roseisolibacter sp. H3M3-2]
MPSSALRRSAAAAAALALAACAAPAVAPTAPGARRRAAGAGIAPIGATMRFGRPDMNAFAHMAQNAMAHAQAGHAVDRVYPGTVVIARGQTVAFESFPVHQVAVYAPGTRPEDVRLDAEHLADAETPWGTFPDVLIDDPASRLAVSPLSFERITWTPDAATFDRPGRYLVLCTLVFHFVPTRMYGWVEVR